MISKPTSSLLDREGPGTMVASIATGRELSISYSSPRLLAHGTLQMAYAGFLLLGFWSRASLHLNGPIAIALATFFAYRAVSVLKKFIESDAEALRWSDRDLRVTSLWRSRTVPWSAMERVKVTQRTFRYLLVPVWRTRSLKVRLYDGGSSSTLKLPIGVLAADPHPASGLADQSGFRTQHSSRLATTSSLDLHLEGPTSRGGPIRRSRGRAPGDHRSLPG